MIRSESRHFGCTEPQRFEQSSLCPYNDTTNYSLPQIFFPNHTQKHVLIVAAAGQGVQIGIIGAFRAPEAFEIYISKTPVDAPQK